MRKDAEVKVTSLQEELQESKSSNQELEKNLTDRKKKLADERQRFETEMEEIKSKYEVCVQWRSVVEIYVYSILFRMRMCTQIKDIRSLYMKNTAEKQCLPQ